MRLLVAAVGRLKDGAEQTLCSRYAERASAAGRALALGPLSVVEIREGSAKPAAERKTDEARRLLAGSTGSGRIIALDEYGRARTSTEFAEMLRAERDKGGAALAFLIGGPDGHGEAALTQCHEQLSLGPMTLPHGLARVVLLEQIYRAITILSGHPYHRA